VIANITLPSFQIVGLDGFIFDVRDVVFDFSDSRNDEAVRYPQGYEGKYMIPGAATLWRGIYAGYLDITLPKAFGDVNGNATRFSASGMLIDDNGITGLFSAENILSFENGSASGWSFSVNTFRLELEANKLIAAGFAGQIGLPFNGDKTKLGYDALIRENNEYLMVVNPMDSLDFSIFNAKATILPNSYLKLHVVNDRFRPEALLHGSMTLKGGSDVPVNVPTLDFQSLCLKTEDPYISIEYLGYHGKVSLGAFPVSLNGIALKGTGKGKVELCTGIEVGLCSKDFGLYGLSNMAFMASLKENDGRQKWQFDGVRLDAITLNATIAGVVGIEGQLVWHRNDPIYGNGFFGEMNVRVKPCGNMAVKMHGCFGSVDDYRYWFVEGGVELPVGIPIVGPLTIKGFSGAVSYKMVGTGKTLSSGSAFTSSVYKPDARTGLGLKSSVLLDIAKVASGEACFDIAFTDRGGLSYIGFYGYAQFAGNLTGKGGMDNLNSKYNDIIQKEQQYASDFETLQKYKQFEPNKAAEIVAPIPADFRYGITGDALTF
jgi:hypothetical protein